jgi:glycosyltransferase involved in cell wall biosynthesis
VAIRAVARIMAARPDLPVMLDLYGRDFAEVGLADLARELGLADRVVFHGRIPIEAVPAALAAADIALSPTRRNPFTEHSLSTKLFESVAMAKPTVATRLPLVEQTFRADEIRTYAPGDAEDLARAVLAYVDDPEDRERRVARARARVADMSWEREAVRYLELVGLTISRRGRPPGR